MSAYRVITISGSNSSLDQYKGFIIKNWLETLRCGNDWFKLIDKKAYYSVYRQVICSILARPNCKVNIAILEEDPDVCFGWSVYEGGNLHYCFVQKDGRNSKIGSSLMPENVNCITHLTVVGALIWQKKFPEFIFNPFV